MPNTPRELDEVVPDEHRDRTSDHAGQRTLHVGAAPIQGAQGERAERGAEARPSVGHHPEDRRVLVVRHDDAEHEHRDEREARHDHDLAVGGVFLDDPAEDVLSHRGAAISRYEDEELIDAAKMPDTTTPHMNGGKIIWDSTMNTFSA